MQTFDQSFDTQREYQSEILKYIMDIGTSLRLQMDIDTLLKRISEAACKALRFRHVALYLADGAGFFRVSASSDITPEDEDYLRQHPLSDDIVALLLNEQYRISESYFLPGEAPIWKNEHIASFFVIDERDVSNTPPSSSDKYWTPEDLVIVPLVSGDNSLLGFLTPDSPLDGLRPTAQTMSILELFANQAAVAIEGARLYGEARRSSEERAALVEIGRALSAPDALHDLQTVYQTIYEQVQRVMATDAFFIARYSQEDEELVIDYLIDCGVVYPPSAYPSVPPGVHTFLHEEKVGYLFSTMEEYKAFVHGEMRDGHDDLIGNQQIPASSLFVPIHFSGKTIGFISAQNYHSYAYTQRHLEMLKEIAVQVGIAITNARRYTNLREALKQAQESEQLKNHFLMTASHELRTPLTAVQGYIELLYSFGPVLDEESKVRFIGNARRACEELVLLLGNVMDTSRIDQDRVSLSLEAVQVSKTVRVILEILEPTITREERAIEVNIADDLYIWADDLRLRQILLNIVGNALKYTLAPSSISISASSIERVELIQHLSSAQITIAIPPLERFALIAIRDWGAGISKEDQVRLFTKFMRLDSAINSIQRGAGLGLYLCRELTEAMNGQIWLESEGIPGEGSTFFIVLPLSS
ncbi:MAG: ATP-binding protein [Chloroflexota bacterium]|nr:ATP-binding protein [Chloroflexota bacterium]